MSVRVAGNTIFIEGACQVADAEPILSALLEDSSYTVDLGGAARLHSAVIQLLLALRPRIVGAPADTVQAKHILLLLDAVYGSAQPAKLMVDEGGDGAA